MQLLKPRGHWIVILQHFEGYPGMGQDEIVAPAASETADFPVRTLDPAFRRLLDDLEKPQKDPDQPMAEVWIPWCQGHQLVPIGVECTVDFGQWCGPPMAAREIIIYGRRLDNGHEGYARGPDSLAVVCPGENVYVCLLVRIGP